MGYEVIKILAKEKNISLEEIAKEAEISYNSLSKIIRNTVGEPKFTTMAAIARALELTADQLAIEVGLSLNNAGNKLTMTSGEQTHIKKYRSLDDHGKEAVTGILDIEVARVEGEKARAARYQIEKAKAKNAKSAEETAPDFTRTIQLHVLPAAAGPGEFLDSNDFDVVEVGAEVPLSANFGVRISGDSMEPDYPDGYIAWVKRIADIDYGQIGVFIMDGHGYIKEKGKKGLISLNPDYAPIKVREFEDCRTCGLVVGVTEDIY